MKKGKSILNDDLTSLFDFLDNERAQSKWDLAENYSLDVEKRVENHKCILNARVIFVDFNQLCVECHENFSRFREGDILLLHKQRYELLNPFEGFEMNLIECDPVGNHLLFEKSYKNKNKKIPFVENDLLVIDDVEDTLQEVVKNNLKKNLTSVKKKLFFKKYLLGQLDTQRVKIDQPLRNKIVEKLSLNEAQLLAFDNVISKYPVVGVQGPPGTGKTYLLAAICIYYMVKGIDILVTAVSHFAINNALNKISDLLDEFDYHFSVVKVSKNKNTGLKKEVIRISKIKLLDQGVTRKPVVYGMTAFKFPYEVDSNRFSLLILDEASQASLPFGFMAMGYAKKIVLIGDHKQMRPIMNYPYHPSKLKVSIFEHHFSMYPETCVMLNETFRLSEELLKIPSELFYQSKLVSSKKGVSVTVYSSEEKCIDTAIQESGIFFSISSLVEYLFASKKASYFIEVDHSFSSKISNEEAILVAEIVSYCLQKNIYYSKDIAILVPFRAQQMHLRKVFQRYENKYSLDFDRVLIDTVDRMQGQERKLIIYSLTISDIQKIASLADYYFNCEKFNVALTRSKERRIFVGSKNMLLTRVDDPEIAKKINIFAEFFENENCLKIETSLLK